jgi:hypothetical protein
VREPVLFTSPVERGAVLLAKQLGYRIEYQAREALGGPFEFGQ